MSIFNEINDDQKKKILDDAKQSLLFELINYLLRIGIDPDSFDIETFNFQEFEMFGEGAFRMAQICDSLKIINRKLSEIG